jgi:hypothetical protein
MASGSLFSRIDRGIPTSRTFPYPLRFLFAAQLQVLSQVLRVAYRALDLPHQEGWIHRRFRPQDRCGDLDPAIRLRTQLEHSFPHALPRSRIQLRRIASGLPSRTAASACEARRRDQFEKLCRCITRPAIANKHLSTNERGQVIYKFKWPFRGGSTT